MNITTIKNAVTSNTARTLLKLKKNYPQILFVTGMAGVAVSNILTARAALKLERSSLIEEMGEKVKSVNELRDIGDESYSKADYVKDVASIYGRFVWDVTKIFAPPTIVGVVSVFCLTKSHNMLTAQNEALIAAAVVLDKAYTNYREKVAEKFGKDADRDIVLNEKLVPTVVDGKKTADESVAPGDPSQFSPYARFFDEMSIQWNDRADYNQMFLNSQQNYFNDLLRTRGHVFLNEVYDALGIPRSQAGAIVGWVYQQNNGDDYIDFGIYQNSERKRMFVNGYEKSILLDFNVDGVIYDLI